ncbi:anti-sigma factor [Oleiagrimonas sp. C23AA]|uniref:anti-sigma factor n=1 Tax=Oleiagrimonas sp. C23AA TaxID=2719047 RepID=UPI001421FB13|nr:anti-sigma factor [Oleiagrimonas sp. C23AA]NII10447.1 anti-sigma factor [Oleiagrimonas sp. C23AA]
MSEFDESADTPNREDLRLAEYVLGTLDGEERREVEGWMDADPRIAARVETWQERFAQLANQVAPADAPAYIWARILARIEPERVALESTAPATRPGLWQSLTLWRWLGAGSLAVAALVVIIVLGVMPTQRQHGAPGTRSGTELAATIRTDNGQAAFTASIDASGTRMTVIPTAAWKHSGKVPELWLIAPGSKTPEPLGVIAQDHATVMTIPAALRGQARSQALLAISVEPPGGSPTGLPTGPVIAKGAVNSI